LSKGVTIATMDPLNIFFSLNGMTAGILSLTM